MHARTRKSRRSIRNTTRRDRCSCNQTPSRPFNQTLYTNYALFALQYLTGVCIDTTPSRKTRMSEHVQCLPRVYLQCSILYARRVKCSQYSRSLKNSTFRNFRNSITRDFRVRLSSGSLPQHREKYLTELHTWSERSIHFLFAISNFLWFCCVLVFISRRKREKEKLRLFRNRKQVWWSSFYERPDLIDISYSKVVLTMLLRTLCWHHYKYQIDKNRTFR